MKAENSLRLVCYIGLMLTTRMIQKTSIARWQSKVAMRSFIVSEVDLASPVLVVKYIATPILVVNYAASY